MTKDVCYIPAEGTREYELLVEQKISSEAVFDGKLLHVKCDCVKLPNGHEATREWIAHPGASAVLPLLPNGDVVLVRQYRYPIGRITLEIPAGKLDALGEDPLLCAKRELSEETGYSANDYQKLHTLATTVGFSNEWIHIYLAQELIKGEQHPDEDEFLNVVTMPLHEAVELIHKGDIVDGKTVIALLLVDNMIRANEGLVE